MSNPKKAIQEIKSLMKQFGFLSEEVELMSFKLADNTILQAEKLEVGKSIVKINDAFEQVTLEDGTYRVDNFNVDVVEGKIEAIKEVFVDAKLIDGTQIKVEGDSVVEGAKVMVVTEEGEIVAPDGVHELEGGMKVETKEGLIVSVSEPKMEEEKPEVEIKVESDMGGMKELYSLLEDMMKKVSEKMKNMEEKMEAMNSQFKAFKSEPAGKKISDGKTEFNNQENLNSVDAKIANIMSLRNNK
jgi:hypothetical protein